MKKLWILLMASVVVVWSFVPSAYTVPRGLNVSGGQTNQALRYDGQDGALIDVFASGAGLDEPVDLELRPNGNLGGFF
ncbi:MAG: hypothetical protein JSV60_03380 [Desulfobacterales bacterium]|nr:MAG: hypothetical protein JSV60_03380 [Desulfobacterales bacterium]